MMNFVCACGFSTGASILDEMFVIHGKQILVHRCNIDEIFIFLKMYAEYFNDEQEPVEKKVSMPALIPNTPRRRWREEEDNALLLGVHMHGRNWVKVMNFNDVLVNRTVASLEFSIYKMQQ
ncbi:hypothetical protein V6N13_000819 [Hibiscus sabdariffa]